MKFLRYLSLLILIMGSLNIKAALPVGEEYGEGYETDIPYETAFEEELKAAIGASDIAKIQELTKKGMDLNEKVIHDEFTFLEYAIAQKKPNIVEVLIKAGADVNKINMKELGEETNTPLGQAIEMYYELKKAIIANPTWAKMFNQDLENLKVIIRILMQYGANLNQPVNAAGETPLTYARRLNLDELIPILEGKE